MTAADSAWGRRRVMGLSAATAAGIVVSGCRTQAGAATAAVPPTEDLMREHGLLKRVLLIYQEAIRRLRAGTQVPPQALGESANIIRTFIEDYHEHLEEAYVFPRLRKAGKLTDTVNVLLTQHRKGRMLTSEILTGATAQGMADKSTRNQVITAMAAFNRMYAPHEAREDTVVFPTFRQIVPDREFAELGERFEDEEHRRFGAKGFEGMVDRVADIEKELGIYDLNQFTPRV